MEPEPEPALEPALEQAISQALLQINELEIVPKYLLPGTNEFFVAGQVFGVRRDSLYARFLHLCQTSTELNPTESLVTLLATTENITVLNRRKKMCQSGDLELLSELRLTEIVLQSHLYKHCKSACLWFHRQWILNQLRQININLEFEIVSKAAVHHPKNYYAWNHMRWCCRVSGQKPPIDLVRELCFQNVSDVSMWSFLAYLDDI